jgi:hypothetical protein
MEQELDHRRELNYGIASNWNQTQGLASNSFEIKSNFGFGVLKIFFILKNLTFLNFIF